MNTIRQCRKKQGLSQKALAEFCHVDQTAVSKWELGKSYPDVPVAMRLSALFGVSLDSIYENPLSFGLLSIPVYRHLRPQNLSMHMDSGEDTIECSVRDLERHFTREELLSDPSVRMNLARHFFAMEVTGAAMESRYREGDVVLVKKQPHVNSDQFAAVCIDSEEARLYQIKWHKKGIVLHSLNKAFEPVFFTKSECDSGTILILGLVVDLKGKTY